ncbi:RteC domain-containing protein [Maribacter sp. 2308TA10-17]|uniref:RteC domain-containing protein n=1 Tax=Maribacter sp. 2308TA10-17 TaxID=3386276 RepID=UPI0039BD2358
MERALLSEKLLEELNVIEATVSEVIKKCDLSISKCRDLIYRFKKQISNFTFKSVDAEIQFFKFTKQLPLSNLVYYSELRSFEIQFPLGNQEVQKKYIQKKMDKINRFFRYNLDFVQYIEQDKKHLDESYFTRAYFKDVNITYSRHYYRDKDFCTSHDLLLAKLSANKRLIAYLKKRFSKINENCIPCDDCSESNLKWTFSNTAYVELLYALSSVGAINDGKVEISLIDKVLRKAFNHDSGDIYKIYSEIRRRKKSRAKFMEDLTRGLEDRMDSADA